jgi:hypothetical protein
VSFAAFRAVTEARTDGRLAGGTVLAVGLSAAEHTDRYGELRAGVRAIGEWAGVTKSTAARHVAALVAAGVYEMAVPAAGHRAAHYVLASHPEDATPVDKLGLVSHPRDAIASHDTRVADDLASQTDTLSLVVPVCKPRLASHDTRVTSPVDVPARVASLRDRLNGSKP